MPDSTDASSPSSPETSPDRFASLAEVQAWLGQATDYERMVKYAMKRGAFDLGRVERFFNALNGPQTAYECIHIAGTKGKGSVTTMLDTLLLGQGIASARYTSPHLEVINERMVIGGRMVSDAEIVDAFNDMWPVLDRFQHSGDALTFFEIITGCALCAFRDAEVDIAVLETGLGGRLDATNVVMPALTIITNVGHDHHDKLGDELTDIAYEKAGIIKPDIPLLTGSYEYEALEVVLAKARELQAPVRRYGEDFGARNIQPTATGISFESWSKQGPTYKKLELPMIGASQATNASMAIEALWQLYQADLLDEPDEDAIRESLRTCAVPGRCEFVAQRGELPCDLLLDVAHNAESFEQLAKVLRSRFPDRHIVGLMAFSSDKDHESMLEIIGDVIHQAVFTSFGGPRATPLDKLQAVWAKYGNGSSSANEHMAHAFRRATELCAGASNALLVICGSFYLVGALRGQLLKGEIVR